MTVSQWTLPLSTVFALFLCVSVPASELSGKVIGISDGDTITVLTVDKREMKVRLAGIDAPESGQPFSDKSKANLSRLVFGKTVNVEWHKIDRYGRTIGKVITQGADANLEQIRAGFAWHYKDYAAEQSAMDRARYAEAEVSAKKQRSGIWSAKSPEAPWAHRKARNTPQQPGATDRQVQKPADEPRYSDSNCLCATQSRCTGKRGGVYCVNAQGNKRYEK